MSTAEAMFNKLRVSGSQTSRRVNISHAGMFVPDQTTTVSVKLREFAGSIFGYRTPSAPPATQDPRIRYFLKLTNGLVELNNEEYDEEFLEPTKYAYDCARRFMLEAYKVFQYALLTPHYVPDGEGGIRIEWENGTRELRLICPSSESKSPYLYHEDGDEYGVDEQVTDSKLNERLQGLIGA